MPIRKGSIRKGEAYYNQKTNRIRTVIDIQGDDETLIYVLGDYRDYYLDNCLPDIQQHTVKIKSFARWADL